MFAFERFMGIGEAASSFSVQLRCFSPPFFQNYDTQKINELTYGGKILLPTSCLDNLVRRNIQWPMLFKLTNINPEHQKSTHAGVLEFLAEEGRCYLPSWMMNQLCLLEGDIILVEYRSLPAATYAKFKPMSTDFYHVTNPKAMLEVELRKFACLTKGDVIAVQYNEQIFEFKVMSLKPQNAVTIIECDINIEFDAAEGYVEPEQQKESFIPLTENILGAEGKGDSVAGTPSEDAKDVWKPFAGSGYRLDGKTSQNNNAENDRKFVNRLAKPNEKIAQTAPSTSRQRAESKTQIQDVLAATPIIVDENYVPGQLTFVRCDYKSRAVLEKLAKEQDDDFGQNDSLKPFSGKGQTIR